jgi:DNA-binding NtrC family response regulator
MSETVLLVDDQIDLLRGLERLLSMELGCRVLSAENGVRALEIVDSEPVDAVVADIQMPKMDGMALLKAIKEADPTVAVIIMTAYGTIERAVDAIKAGAYDFIQKPFDEDRLIHMLKKALELNRLVRENERLRARVCESEPFENMVGQSRPLRDVFSTIRMLAESDVTVLILGETGTGKDLAAQAIHALSGRRSRRLVTVNCPALPENILESELFGYRKGAFTGAEADKEGLFDKARGGTIFLDEIGDLSLSVQTKLLRVLQDKTVQPLGSTETHEVDVRIIAATNRDLEQKMRENHFREDLYYRLNVASLTMPPLRRLREDIPLLVDHFLQKIASEQNTEAKRLSPELVGELAERPWPGNIRELENTLRGWCAVARGPEIRRAPLPGAAPAPSDPDSPGADLLRRSYKELKEEAIETFTLGYVKRLLEHTSGNITLAGQISGIKRQSLQKIIRRYGISVDQYRTAES